jgi:hypothetical protein
MIMPMTQVLDAYEPYPDPNFSEYVGYIDTRDNVNVVQMKVDVYENIGNAENHYERLVQKYESTETMGLVDGEAVLHIDNGTARGAVRKSNAVAEVVTYEVRNPETESDIMFNPRSHARWTSRNLVNYWGGTERFRENRGYCRQEIIDKQDDVEQKP